MLAARLNDSPSAQDRELLRLLAEGHTDESVARRLGCTRRTFQRRLRKILNELGANSRFQAGVLSERIGWIPRESASTATGVAHSRQLEQQESRPGPSNEVAARKAAPE